MKNLKITLIALAVLFFGSCKEQDLMDHQVKPALYFENKDNGQKDSLMHSFFNINSSFQSYTVEVIINTMGELSDVDRPIHLIQSNVGEPHAAQPGVHYVALDDPSMQKHLIIPANKATATIPITLLKDPSLETEEVRIILEVAGNEYFQPGIEKFKQFHIRTTAIPFKPTNWGTIWSMFFGPTWGPVKMKFIIDTVGDVDWDLTPDMGYAFWLGAEVKGALATYNFDHPGEPLKEKDGTLVAF